MKPSFFKTNAHLLICTDERCAAQGSRLLFKSVWNGLETERLAYYKTGGSLRLSHSGCLGACQFSPAVTCYFKRNGALHEAWYHDMDYPKTMQLARALNDGLEPPVESRYDE
jgi:(2Fe-2S) ferredoxin